MGTVLQINSSIHAETGQSTQLADEFVERLQQQNPALKRVVRDLAVEPVPHLDAQRFAAFTMPAGERDTHQQALVSQSDRLISELREAGIIVLGLPMYNFGVPSQLKAYFDHVARAGETFRYTDNGPIGLLAGKRAYVLATRGGQYAGTARDTQTNYVRDFLRFIGIEQVEFVYAEGLATGDENRDNALAAAHSSIRALAQVNLANAA